MKSESDAGRKLEPRCRVIRVLAALLLTSQRLHVVSRQLSVIACSEHARLQLFIIL